MVDENGKLTSWNKGMKMPYKPRPSMIGRTAWNKGKHICLNSGRTHFKKGEQSVNKGKEILITRGANHWNWKGGLRGFDYIERRRFKSQMQPEIFDRDNYTCQICGIRGVDLQVHHIKEWAKYPEFRFDIDNCQTLCASCHYQLTFKKPMPKEIRAWGHNLMERGVQP